MSRAPWASASEASSHRSALPSPTSCGKRTAERQRCPPELLPFEGEVRVGMSRRLLTRSQQQTPNQVVAQGHRRHNRASRLASGRPEGPRSLQPRSKAWVGRQYECGLKGRDASTTINHDPQSPGGAPWIAAEGRRFRSHRKREPKGGGGQAVKPGDSTRRGRENRPLNPEGDRSSPSNLKPQTTPHKPHLAQARRPSQAAI